MLPPRGVADGRLSMYQPAGAPPGVPGVIISMRPASVPWTPVLTSLTFRQSSGRPAVGLVWAAWSVMLIAWISPISAEYGPVGKGLKVMVPDMPGLVPGPAG